MRTLVFLCLSAALCGQNAVVSGRVLDPSQAVVPNATVELTNRATAIKTATTTNAEGYFVLPPLAPGATRDPIRGDALAEQSPVAFHVVRYPDAGHGFHCDQRDSFHETSAKDGWTRTMALSHRPPWKPTAPATCDGPRPQIST